MNPSANSLLHRRFSHIYVERRALDYPLTHRLLQRYQSSQVVEVENYKRVFTRTKQDFQIQKQTLNMILAIKRAPFHYRASEQCQSFGFENFFYTTPMLNCLFNCEYCYLQGMYPSAYLVFFVNHQDFLDAARNLAADTLPNQAPLLLSISYDTDILPFERTTHYARDWIQLAAHLPNLHIEIRTRSAAFSALQALKASPRVVLSWSLSPESIARQYEHGAPSLARRLKAIKRAITKGWSVRLCFDPVLPTSNPKQEYAQALQDIFCQIKPHQIKDVAIGPFRMGNTHFRRIRKMRPDSALFYHDDPQKNQAVVQVVVDEIRKYLPQEKVALWMLQS